MKILEIDNICKKFGEKTIHNGISFQLNEGERVAILGPSGTGKSVLLREIIGLDSIDSGKIIYKGTRILRLAFSLKQRSGRFPPQKLLR